MEYLNFNRKLAYEFNEKSIYYYTFAYYKMELISEKNTNNDSLRTFSPNTTHTKRSDYSPTQTL